MTDYQRVIALFDDLGVPYGKFSSRVESRMYDPKAVAEAFPPGPHESSFNYEFRIRQLADHDQRLNFWISIAQGYLVFNSSEAFKGTVADEFGTYTPNTKGTGYWPLPEGIKP